MLLLVKAPKKGIKFICKFNRIIMLYTLFFLRSAHHQVEAFPCLPSISTGQLLLHLSLVLTFPPSYFAPFMELS